MVYTPRRFALAGKVPTCKQLSSLIRVHVLFRGPGAFECYEKILCLLEKDFDDVLVDGRIAETPSFSVLVNGALIFEQPKGSKPTSESLINQLLSWVVKQVNNARQGKQCTKVNPITTI